MAKSSPGGKGNPAASTTATARAKKSAVEAPSAPASRLAAFLSLADAPRPIQRAVKLMLAAVAVTFVWGIYQIVVSLAFRSTFVNAYIKDDHLTLKQANSQISSGIFWTVLEIVIFSAVWVLMARMNREGRNWARIASTALFLVWTYWIYQSISGLRVWFVLGLILIELVIWGLGCGALYNLWRPESAPHFKPAAAPAPARPAPAKASSAKASSARTAPAGTGPGKTGSAKTGSGKTAPSGSGSGKATAAKTRRAAR